MYKILGGDGNEYGPISADTVRQWIAESRLGAASKIQPAGSTEWKTLSEFAEFADALGAGAAAGSRGQTPPPVPAGPTRMSRMAVSSLVLGLFGWLVITAIAGLVCGIVAMTKIKRSQGRLRGQGLALAGTIISGCMLILVVPVAMMAALLLPALGAAKGKAQTIVCVNNMKQIGLALRIYSGDNNDRLPADLLVMTNELGSPVVLFCPADPVHTRPMSSSWWGLTTNNISYEYLTPGAYESNVVNSVVLRCPIHGNVGLGDGSVQQRNARTVRTPAPPTVPGAR